MNAASNARSYDIPYKLILVFLLLAFGIGLAGYVYYTHQKTTIIAEKQNELSAIADLKIAQIKYWREEQIKDAQMFSENFLIAELVRQLAENPEARSLQDEVFSIVQSMKKRYDYANIIVLDAKGKLLLSTDKEKRQIAADTFTAAMQAVSANKALLSDLHRDGEIVKPHMEIYVPITGQKDGRPYGILVMLIDPYQFLYPLIQNWPTPSPSAETLIVRREGDDVLFLNELRHKKDTALSLRLPLTQEQLPSAMAALGKEGIFEGLDYRKVPVVAAAKKIPGSPWFLVSKIDEEEIHAVSRKRTTLISLIVIVLILASGSSVGLLWWQQRVRYYRKQLDAEVQFSEELQKTSLERERLLLELQEALANVKTLSEMLPICSYCKKVRDDKGYWDQVDSYISKHTDTVFSHSICPECAEKALKEIEEYKKKSR